jgi:hypothetical protein
LGSVVAGLHGISPWLERQFDEAAAAAELSLNLPVIGLTRKIFAHTEFFSV